MRPARSVMHVTGVWLLNVRQNPAAHTYTWPTDITIRIPLGPAGP